MFSLAFVPATIFRSLFLLASQELTTRTYSTTTTTNVLGLSVGVHGFVEDVFPDPWQTVLLVATPCLHVTVDEDGHVYGCDSSQGAGLGDVWLTTEQLQSEPTALANPNYATMPRLFAYEINFEVDKCKEFEGLSGHILLDDGKAHDFQSAKVPHADCQESQACVMHPTS
eukprot:g20004.t1